MFQTPTPSLDSSKQLNQYACIRCRRLKKRCSKESPKCENCARQHVPCEYVERKNKRRYSADMTQLPGGSITSVLNPGHSPNESNNNDNATNSNTATTLPPIRNEVPNSSTALPSLTSNSNLSKFPVHPKSTSTSSTSSTLVSTNPTVVPAISPIPNSAPATVSNTRRPDYVFSSAAEESVVNSLCSLQHQSSVSRTNYHSSSTSASSFNTTQFPSQQQQQYHQSTQLPFFNSSSSSGYALTSATKRLKIVEPTSTINLAHSNLVCELLGSSSPSNINKYSPLSVPFQHFETEEILFFLDTYLQYNHLSYHILNESEFKSKIKSINFDKFLSYSNDEEDIGFQFEVNMMLAIGCITLEKMKILSKERCCSSYFASRSLNLLNKLTTMNDIQSIRALILLCIYSFFNKSTVYAWNIVGLLTRLTISIGLNRHIKKIEASRMTATQIEMRYRLFWSIYNLDRLISISLGRPVAIQDDDINVPLPESINDEEQSSLLITKSIIELRRIEGLIISNVHCMRASDKYDTSLDKENIIMSLRQEIEKWYNQSRVLSSTMSIHPITTPTLSKTNRTNINATSPTNSASTTSTPSINPTSFHLSTAWISSRYYHLLMLLYKPSYLYPSPPPSHLEILSKSTLQNLSFTYNLYTSNILPLNWITLYRFLVLCSTLLYGMSTSACEGLNPLDCKTDIHLCIEVLNLGYIELFDGTSTVFVKDLARIFKYINDGMFELSLSKSQEVNNDTKILNGHGLINRNTANSGRYDRNSNGSNLSNGNVNDNVDTNGNLASSELVGTGLKKFHEILFENSVNLWYDDEIYDL